MRTLPSLPIVTDPTTKPVACVASMALCIAARVVVGAGIILLLLSSLFLRRLLARASRTGTRFPRVVAGDRTLYG